MRKSTRIKILKIQIDKLDDEKYKKDQKWTIQTLTYINRFFGVDSPQSKYMNDFKFHGYIPHNATKEYIEKDRIEQIESVKRFLQDCIEIVNNNGIYVRKNNFLERLSNQTLIALIIFLIPSIIYVGYLFGIATTDSRNVMLRQENAILTKENNSLNDSLLRIKTPFHKSNFKCK